MDDPLVCQVGNDATIWPAIDAGHGSWPYENTVPWDGTPHSTREKRPYFLRARARGSAAGGSLHVEPGHSVITKIHLQGQTC